jgi:hypothetical protein
MIAVLRPVPSQVITAEYVGAAANDILGCQFGCQFGCRIEELRIVVVPQN